ncbi:MAG: hypothetical protein HQL93_02590 [Magnetococcales bacterium]|nr:hypothetical protein [Magnetococcales bacterium]
MTEDALELIHQVAQAQAHVRALQQVLSRIPHGRGDHTDLCRMANEGMPPVDNDHCQCHVALIRKALADKY